MNSNFVHILLICSQKNVHHNTILKSIYLNQKGKKIEKNRQCYICKYPSLTAIPEKTCHDEAAVYRTL